ncbi:MAG: hypothetical protein PHC64_02540 [Candidatus Gastranaerophilales bacterium]|nr:hypothetical protein [Candidatus Gastranaerophilales bacterium]
MENFPEEQEKKEEQESLETPEKEEEIEPAEVMTEGSEDPQPQEELEVPEETENTEVQEESSEEETEDNDEYIEEKPKKSEITQEFSGISDIESIQFDEVIDIDKIQEKLAKQDFSKEEIEEEEEEAESNMQGIIKETEQSSQLGTEPKDIVRKKMLIDPNSKKYVVYINPENINFMEKLSVEERKNVINKLLKEQNEFLTKTKRVRELSHFFKHAVLASVTAVIFFPLMFILVNKSLETTINNYSQAKQNFMRLYKQEGKIRMQH